jgi:hypothetical protein
MMKPMRSPAPSRMRSVGRRVARAVPLSIASRSFFE